MFARVQTFGIDNAADFALGSKARTHFATLAQQVIKDSDAVKAQQDGGIATAKSFLLDALRLDLQAIASTAAVGRLIKTGMAEVTQLDAIMRNKYAHTADSRGEAETAEGNRSKCFSSAAWESASHIERAPQREKKPAPAPANPPK